MSKTSSVIIKNQPLTLVISKKNKRFREIKLLNQLYGIRQDNKNIMQSLLSIIEMLWVQLQLIKQFPDSLFKKSKNGSNNSNKTQPTQQQHWLEINLIWKIIDQLIKKKLKNSQKIIMPHILQFLLKVVLIFNKCLKTWHKEYTKSTLKNLIRKGQEEILEQSQIKNNQMLAIIKKKSVVEYFQLVFIFRYNLLTIMKALQNLTKICLQFLQYISNNSKQLMSLVRKKAPQVICPAWYKNQFIQFNLQQYRGKYVLLFFYPNDFSFVCPTQIISFSNNSAEFREVGCQVFAISTNSVFNHMEYTKKSRSQGGLGSIDIPLLSDITQNITKNYGCLCQPQGVAFRGTYIIDKNGIVRHESVLDRQVGRNPQEYLRLVKAFIFSDQSGQVCPVKWEPGQKSMIPNTNINQYKQVISSMQIQYQ